MRRQDIRTGELYRAKVDGLPHQVGVLDTRPIWALAGYGRPGSYRPSKAPLVPEYKVRRLRAREAAGGILVVIDAYQGPDSPRRLAPYVVTPRQIERPWDDWLAEKAAKKEAEAAGRAAYQERQAAHEAARQAAREVERLERMAADQRAVERVEAGQARMDFWRDNVAPLLDRLKIDGIVVRRGEPTEWGTTILTGEQLYETVLSAMALGAIATARAITDNAVAATPATGRGKADPTTRTTPSHTSPRHPDNPTRIRT